MLVIKEILTYTESERRLNMKANRYYEIQRRHIMRMVSSGKIDIKTAEELIAQVNYAKELNLKQ